MIQHFWAQSNHCKCTISQDILRIVADFIIFCNLAYFLNAINLWDLIFVRSLFIGFDTAKFTIALVVMAFIDGVDAFTVIKIVLPACQGLKVRLLIILARNVLIEHVIWAVNVLLVHFSLLRLLFAAKICFLTAQIVATIATFTH